MKSKYEQAKSGKWIWPKRRGYKMICCDCGLVHKIDFALDHKSRILVRFWRDKRATAAIRREARKRRDKRLSNVAGYLSSYYATQDVKEQG